MVCLLDEMEFLITKNQSVVYNFLQWSRAIGASFVLIGVANAMDVVDRLLLGRYEPLDSSIPHHL